MIIAALHREWCEQLLKLLGRDAWRAAFAQPPPSAIILPQLPTEALACRNIVLFLNFSYICPEPVLANIRLSV